MKRVFSIAVFLFCALVGATNLNLLSTHSFAEISRSEENYLHVPVSPTNDVWGFERNGKSYAVVGVANGVEIVDVSHPRHPVSVSYPYVGCITEWRDIKVYKDYLYIVNDYTSMCNCIEQPCQQLLIVQEGSQNLTFIAEVGNAQADLRGFPNGVQGELVYPEENYFGCANFTEDFTGKVVLIDRGGDCSFSEKTLNVQHANGVAIVIVDEAVELLYPSMYGDALGVAIPGLMIGNEDGRTIKSLLADGVTLVADLNSQNKQNSSFYSGPDGLYILDISDVSNGNIAVVNQTFDFFSFAHNIFIEPERPLAYICGYDRDGQGVLVFDLTNPTQPRLISTFSKYYIHDVEVELRPNGDYVLYACAINNNLVVVLDVNNPWSNSNLDDFVISETHTLVMPHNTAQTEDGNYLYVTHESFSLPVTIYDSSDLRNLTYVGSFSYNSEHDTSPHNAEINAGLLWMSYYSEGVLVYNITETPENPQLIANYDTSTFTSGFHGVWGVYPFTPTNNITYASDIENGLFVLELDAVVIGTTTRTPEPSPTLYATISVAHSVTKTSASVSSTPSYSLTNSSIPGNITESSSGNGGGNTLLLIGSIIGSVVGALFVGLIIILIAIGLLVLRRRMKKQQSNPTFDEFDDTPIDDDLIF